MALRLTFDVLKTETAGGAALAAATALGLILANSPWSHTYFRIFDGHFTIQLGGFAETLSIRAWIREGLMAVFFFVVGLEIKHEVIRGELSSPRRLVLPVTAAIGGMAAPALVYLAVAGLAGGTATGWPVPTATDIAFALGALALVGKGLPQSLRIFLLAMAIADDLGAIGLIAVLYTSHIHAWPLAGAALCLAGLMALGEWNEAPFLFRLVGYLALGAFTLKSGLNTALAGVAAALTTPSGAPRPGQEAILRRYLRALQPYVAFGVLPLFALSAAGVPLWGGAPTRLFSGEPLAIIAALLIGKPLGVLGASWIAIRTGLARRPTGASWSELAGVACLCGVGFSLSLFLAGLAFPNGAQIVPVTLGVMTGSAAAAALGAGVLALAAAARRRARPAVDDEA